MKKMEYTVKVITDGPVDQNEITGAIESAVSVAKATCTNYRVLPKAKPSWTPPTNVGPPKDTPVGTGRIVDAKS